MAVVAIFKKTQKSRYHNKEMTDLREIWHDYAKWVSYPPRPLKSLNFQNPRWLTAAILKKNVQSSYLSNRLTDFDEIWHGDANWPIQETDR